MAEETLSKLRLSNEEAVNVVSYLIPDAYVDINANVYKQDVRVFSIDIWHPRWQKCVFGLIHSASANSERRVTYRLTVYDVTGLKVEDTEQIVIYSLDEINLIGRELVFVTSPASKLSLKLGDAWHLAFEEVG